MAQVDVEEFYLEIVTPEKKFFSDNVEIAIIKTPNGEMGILRSHAPMMMAVSIGPVKIKKKGKWMEAVLTEGFADITQERVIIMVDTAEWPEEIDINRAKRAKEAAEERLQRKLSEMEYTQAQAAFLRAITRLKAGNKG